MKNETQNNLILGLADSLAKGKREGNGQLFFSIEHEGDILGCALRTDIEKPLSLSKLPVWAIDKLVNYFFENNIKIGGVVGEGSTSTEFSEKYSKKFKLPLRIVMHQGVYQLDSLNLPKLGELKLKVADESDLQLVESCISKFIEECFPSEPRNSEEIKIMASRHIKFRVLYMLLDKKGEFLSMACNNRETKNSGCISLVYTAKKFRGRGYGGAVTAYSSKKVLDSGKKFCNLFTDLKNPTSNHIYQKIGYKKIGESKHFSFSEKKE